MLVGNLIRNIFRLIDLGIYPLVFILLVFLLSKNNRIKKAFKENIKCISVNAALVLAIGLTALTVFFLKENTYYTYDYAGHWLRSLELKTLFWDDPSSILKYVYYSMLNNDYSSLPALLSLLSMILKEGSYMQFVIGMYVQFVLPLFILLETIYYSYFDKYKYLPTCIFVCFFPLYFVIFYGEVDCIGMIFISYSLFVTIMNDYKDLNKYDVLGINVSSFLLLFLRRYYLYYVFSMYVLLLIKVIISYIKDKNKSLKQFIKIILTGLPTLLVILLFFRPYVLMVLNNNFSEAYQMYNHDNKLLALIDYFSYGIIVVSIIGIIRLFLNKNIDAYYLLGTIVVTCLMFWRVQSFEYHHYSLIAIQILFLFTYGIYNLIENSKISLIVIVLLVIQSIGIFTDYYNIPGFSKLRRVPEVNENIDAYKEFTHELFALTEGEGIYAYFATGDSNFSKEVCNSVLPAFKQIPKIYDSTLDLRDGFPDLPNISYVVISNPTLYLNSEYQKIYDVVSFGIKEVDAVSKSYEEIYSTSLNDVEIRIYKRVAPINEEAKKYFFQSMVELYPNNSEIFDYIKEWR